MLGTDKDSVKLLVSMDSASTGFGSSKSWKWTILVVVLVGNIDVMRMVAADGRSFWNILACTADFSSGRPNTVRLNSNSSCS